MLRHMEVVWQRRLAIIVTLPLFLLASPFFALGSSLFAAACGLWAEVPVVISNCKEMWSKDFKACKRI